MRMCASAVASNLAVESLVKSSTASFKGRMGLVTRAFASAYFFPRARAKGDCLLAMMRGGTWYKCLPQMRDGTPTRGVIVAYCRWKSRELLERKGQSPRNSSSVWTLVLGLCPPAVVRRSGEGGDFRTYLFFIIPC